MSADTLPKLLVERAAEHPRAVALREKEYGIWQPMTWAQYAERVEAAALGLRALGVERGDRIALLGDNRPEWVIAELAAQAIGAVPIGIYQDSVASEVQYLLSFSGCRILVAEDQEQVDKFLEIRDSVPTVERVVYYDPRGLRAYEEDVLLEFPRLESMGRELRERDGDGLERLAAASEPGDLALLATTSGTTGTPKLAMLTHRNLVTMARNLQRVDPTSAADDFVSLLPLPWIGEQMIGVALQLFVGFAVNFPEEPETVQENLREIGPQTMFAPPRIWENLLSEVQVKVEDTSWLKRRIYDWALRVGFEAADRRLAREALPGSLRARRALAELACCFWIKDKLGLRRLRHAYTGGAALGPDVIRFFHAVGVNLKQIYGQTEVSGISVLHRDHDIKFQTVGTPIPETEVRLADDGEILTRSDAVFGGYYENPEATAESLRDGWLYSGDAGYFDDDGHLVVIDRAKDVMTLSDGTRFSPQFIENKLKFSPYVREAVVFGGDVPFVSAMITIDFGNCGKWAEKRQIAYTTFTDLAQKPEIYELVREHIERMNEDLPGAAKIRSFILLHKELDADDAELTRTRKVRRKFVAERYKEIVTALYDERSSIPVETEIQYQDGRTATTRTELRIEALAKVGADGVAAGERVVEGGA